MVGRESAAWGSRQSTVASRQLSVIGRQFRLAEGVQHETANTVESGARRDGLALLAVAIALVVVSIVSAQAGVGYDLTWSALEGGGGVSAGSGYSLGGAVGRPDAGQMSGGVYSLIGGFWPGAAVQHQVYVPLLLR